MRNDARYHEGLHLFRERQWFECHEVLEALWRELPRGPGRDYVQGLIQLAVSLEHWRRGNPRGAWGQWTKARAKFEGLPPTYEGVALAELLTAFDGLWASVRLEDAVAAQAEGRPCTSAVTEWPTPRLVEDPPPSS
ncbi:MAG: DUF309 domain-containing protein [Myxococcota bacterium]